MKKPLTRRHFLALSGAAAVAAPHAWALRDTANPVRIGIVGVGRRGTELACELTRRNCRIVAVSDVSAARCNRARDGTNAKAYADWTELVRCDDVDAVVVATPDYLHAPMTMAALEAGKDVYCEAPMTRTVAEAVTVKEAAESTGRIIQIGATGLGHRQWETAQRIVSQGLLGEVYWCQSSCPLPSRSQDSDWRGSFETSGGIATDMVFDRLASMMTSLGLGIPDRVSVAGGVYAYTKREVPNSFVMTSEYDGGPKLVLTSANAHAHGAPTVFRGQQATLYVHDRDTVVEAEPGYDQVLKDPFGTHQQEALEPPQSVDLLGNWLDSIRSRQPAMCNPEVAYPVMVAAAMGNEAYHRKQSVAFDVVTKQIVTAPARKRKVA